MNEIKALIRQTCPNFEVNTLEDLGKGDFCRAFLVNKKYVYRFARHENARQSLRRENCLLPKIAGKFSLEIPRPQFASLEGNAEHSFIAYPFLQNPALTQREYLKLDEESRTRCAGQVARFLNELHSVDIELAEKCRIPQLDYRKKYTDLLVRMRETHFRVLEKADFEYAENELEIYLESVEPVNFQPVLLHGDLSPDHVLFDKSANRVTSIIDFGDMMIGDAAWDFLWIYEDYGTDFFKRAIAKYIVKDKKKFIDRIVRFSKFETIAWISECLTNGEQDVAEAVEHLRALKSIAGEINLFSENLPEN